MLLSNESKPFTVTGIGSDQTTDFSLLSLVIAFFINFIK